MNERFRRYTRWADGQERPHLLPLKVVVIPPTQPLKQGFAFARDLILEGSAVGIFGHGITFPEAVPEWARVAGLQLTELGCLYPANEICATETLRRGLIKWFERLAGSGDSTILLSSAYPRFLYSLMEAAPLVEGMLQLRRECEVICSDESWLGARLIGSAARPRRFWRTSLVALTLAGLLLSFFRFAKEAWQRKGLVADLQAERAKQAGLDADFWLVVHHEWYRFNPHLIDSFGLSAVAADRCLGILFQGDFLPGERDMQTLKRTGSAHFQGLGPLLQHRQKLKMEQIVVPETPLGSLKAWRRTLLESLKILSNLVKKPATVRLGNLNLDISRLTSPLSRLLSIDLLRANLAGVATQEALGRSFRSPGVIINYGAQAAGPVAADLAFQASGHFTVDFCHGAGIEMQIPLMHTSSTLATVWTEVDVEVLHSLRTAAVAAGMPVRIHPGIKRPGPRWKILIASNYAHRDTVVGGVYPLSAYHHYLSRLPEELAKKRPDDFEFRWRPHPADSPAEIQKALREHTTQAVELSKQSLSEDLEWADAMVTSMSSVFFEGLLAEIPIFLQVAPRFDQTVYARAVDPDRKFFYLEEGAQLINECLLNEEPPSTSPEQGMRRTFFGPSGFPAPGQKVWETILT